MVSYGWSTTKQSSNIAKHGISFAAAEAFDWETAIVQADTREHYNEVLLVAVGAIGDRLHAMVFTLRRPVVWIISLRKASNKEIREYARESSV